MSQDYNATLNLPKTDFPMRAGLPKSEPETLKNWEEEKLYDKLMEHNEGKLSAAPCTVTPEDVRYIYDKSLITKQMN